MIAYATIGTADIEKSMSFIAVLADMGGLYPDGYRAARSIRYCQ